MWWFWQPCDKIHYSQKAEDQIQEDEDRIKSLERYLKYTRSEYEDVKKYREYYWESTEELTEKKKEIVELREHVSTLRDLLWSAELELRELKGLDVPIKTSAKEKWIEENPHDWDVSFE